ncbi:hypothetical protein PUMCH_004290 [Australozyma saopauloensis]|uniref:Activator of Hsp90 ATPase AHSA1-like N-terminal domain-containing protein n=1 Tax=Australozyma saopauloensis TaxID=291208 RepID=A0AAX4HGB5_9ASCO|nr:hypothetical protein PUMCH_004290 [[Candida] saopauloensis]
MVVNNPNNWHWVDKNCIDWAKAYFDEKLVGLSVKSEEARFVEVKSVSSLEGDVEVCQRKGKVISLFDLRIILNIEGKSTAEKEFKGSITVPELAYDTEEDEIQFEVSIYNEDSDSEKMRLLAKKELIPILRLKLLAFGKDLIESQASDIQLESSLVNSKLTKENQTETSKKTNTAAPAQPARSTSQAASKTSATSTSSNVPKYNTATLHLEPTFNTTAEQLYITLLDVQRVSAWTRSQAQIEPKEGSEFKLFGGSITGKNLKLVENERITQSWRLEDWKAGHYAQLDIQLKQGAGETTMVVKWSGIPIGEEERVRGNFEDYYVRSIKITFGFGAVL